MPEIRLPEMPPIVLCSYSLTCTDYPKSCSTCEHNITPELPKKQSHYKRKESLK